MHTSSNRIYRSTEPINSIDYVLCTLYIDRYTRLCESWQVLNVVVKPYMYMYVCMCVCVYVCYYSVEESINLFLHLHKHVHNYEAPVGTLLPH